MAEILLFPMTARIGRIRIVAEKMLEKSSDRAAGYYHTQVTAALVGQFEKIGLPRQAQHSELAAFWFEVKTEMAKLVSWGHRPGGTAA